MIEEYRDGVGAMRCAACGRALRDAAEGPLVAIRLSDVDRLVCLLADFPRLGFDTPLTDALTKRLTQAAGQSVEQITARAAEIMSPED